MSSRGSRRDARAGRITFVAAYAATLVALLIYAPFIAGVAFVSGAMFGVIACNLDGDA